jgi:hypothetical protein
VSWDTKAAAGEEEENDKNKITISLFMDATYFFFILHFNVASHFLCFS